MRLRHHAAWVHTQLASNRLVGAWRAPVYIYSPKSSYYCCQPAYLHACPSIADCRGRCLTGFSHLHCRQPWYRRAWIPSSYQYEHVCTKQKRENVCVCVHVCDQTSPTHNRDVTMQQCACVCVCGRHVTNTLQAACAHYRMHKPRIRSK